MLSRDELKHNADRIVYILETCPVFYCRDCKRQSVFYVFSLDELWKRYIKCGKCGGEGTIELLAFCDDPDLIEL